MQKCLSILSFGYIIRYVREDIQIVQATLLILNAIIQAGIKSYMGDLTPVQALEVPNGCMDSVRKDPDEHFYCYDDEDK